MLILDDQPRARQSLRALLETNAAIECVGEAGRAVDAIERLNQTNPDVILVDVRMPGMDGLEATRIIKQLKPQIRVIVLTLYPDYRERAIEAGADNFLVKGCPSEQLFRAISAG